MENVMKKLVISAIALAAGLYGATALADTEGSASTHVFVDVTANLAIQPPSGDIDLGDQMTDFQGAAIFRVDANSQSLSLTCGASALYKGNDASGTEVLPLPVNTAAGCSVVPANGNRMGGLPNTLQFGEEGEFIDNFLVMKTENGDFESSQNGHFSQDVTLMVDWIIPLEQPQGEYSGIVALWAAII